MSLKLLALFLLLALFAVYVNADNTKCPSDDFLMKTKKNITQKDCGGSFAHEYQCAGMNYMECVWKLKTWVHVTMYVLSALMILITIVSCFMRCCKK